MIGSRSLYLHFQLRPGEIVHPDIKTDGKVSFKLSLDNGNTYNNIPLKTLLLKGLSGNESFHQILYVEQNSDGARIICPDIFKYHCSKIDGNFKILTKAI